MMIRLVGFHLVVPVVRRLGVSQLALARCRLSYTSLAVSALATASVASELVDFIAAVARRLAAEYVRSSRLVKCLAA